ncbi:MAG: VCBS repeat-containing protein, partial [Flavobacteriales bacterium]|nr:VCBS repeat-containing protein [Flavobacteriales bacterium]
MRMVNFVKCLTLLTGMAFVTELKAQITFTDIAGVGADASNIPFSKDGGSAFADFDLDGDLDLVVNTNDNSGSRRSYFLRNDDGIFTDQTATIAPGLKDFKTERCVTWGDCNNDGYPDFMVNAFDRTTIYRNNAGVNFTRIANITGMTDGQNTEGSGWFDYDNDGDLDLFQENHNFGIDIFQNDGSTPTPVFTQVTINAVGAPGTGAGGLGLPEGGSSTADYAASTDLNLDGYTDLIARRENSGATSGLDLNRHDIFLNQGGGTFLPLTTFSEDAANGNKGGVSTADFDNDGDLDILWTSASASGNRAVLYEHDGVNGGSFTQVVDPFRMDDNSVDTRTDYDGCTVGDIDNDGDEDIFMTANSGTSTLFLNNSSGPGNFQFRQPGPVSVPGAAINFGINVSGNGEGCVFVDHDNDGDLDLYVNRTGQNQLWQNDYIGSATESAAPFQNSYLRVIPKIDLGAGVFRDATNSIVFMQDCDGNTISGIKEVGGGDGHGTQKTPWLHFGLPDGPDEPYLLVVQFPRNGTTLNTVSKVVIPSQLPTILNTSTLDLEQTIIIKDTDEDDTYFCTDTDGDGAYDYADIDDDNDGIPDLVETTTSVSSFQPTCNSFTLDFSGTPTLVSGGALQEGAVYKWSGVAIGTDCLMTIDDSFNATVPILDDNGSDPTYFKPRTAFNLDGIGDRAYIEYKLEFVTGVAETPVVIPELFVNYNDIDGNTSYGEQNWAQYPVSYYVDNPTTLTLEVGDWVIATAGMAEVTGSSNTTPSANFGARYLNVSELRIRLGVEAFVTGSSSGGRNHSIEFACVTNFVDPTTYY